MSGGEIKKRYLNNSSFDLRRFISGSEKFLHSICDSIERFFIRTFITIPCAPNLGLISKSLVIQHLYFKA